MSEGSLQEAIGGTVVPRSDQLGGAYSILCQTGQVIGNRIGRRPPEPKRTHIIKCINQSQHLLFVQSLRELMPVEEVGYMFSGGRNTAHLQGRSSFGSIDPLKRRLMRVSRKHIKIGKSIEYRTSECDCPGCKCLCWLLRSSVLKKQIFTDFHHIANK